MKAQVGTLLVNPSDGGAKRSCDAQAGPFGGRNGSAVTSAQPNSSGKLVSQEFDLGAKAHGSLAIVESLGLRELLAQFLQATAVRRFRLVVEHGPGVAQAISTQIVHR